MSFKFNLEKLLEIRKNERDAKLKLWSIENGKLKILLREEEAISNELYENKKKYSESYGIKDLQAVGLFRMYISTFKFKIADVKNRIKKQKEIIEGYRQGLAEASVRFKAIEKLRENKKNEYNEIENKKNEKFIDELNIMRHKRGNKIGSV